MTVPLLCVKFRMSAKEIKSPVPRFASADLNRDNFVRIRRFRFKFRVRLGWTFERMRVKFQSARIFLTPCIDIKRFDGWVAVTQSGLVYLGHTVRDFVRIFKCVSRE